MAIGLVRPQTPPNNPHGPRAGYHTALLGPRTSTGSPKTSLDSPFTPPAGLLILCLDLTPLGLALRSLYWLPDPYGLPSFHLAIRTLRLALGIASKPL